MSYLLSTMVSAVWKNGVCQHHVVLIRAPFKNLYSRMYGTPKIPCTITAVYPTEGLKGRTIYRKIKSFVTEIAPKIQAYKFKWKFTSMWACEPLLMDDRPTDKFMLTTDEFTVTTATCRSCEIFYFLLKKIVLRR